MIHPLLRLIVTEPQLLGDHAYADAQRAALADVRAKMGTPGAAKRVARMISDLAG